MVTFNVSLIDNNMYSVRLGNHTIRANVGLKPFKHCKAGLRGMPKGIHTVDLVSAIQIVGVIPILKVKVALGSLLVVVNVRGAMNCATTNQLFL